MKIKDVVVWPWRWSTPLGTQQENAPVDDGILIEARVWVGTFNITLIVQCADGRYYGSIRTYTLPAKRAIHAILTRLRRPEWRGWPYVIADEFEIMQGWSVGICRSPR